MSYPHDVSGESNLSAPDAGHMRKLVVTLGDQDHFPQEWIWRVKRKESTVVVHFGGKKVLFRGVSLQERIGGIILFRRQEEKVSKEMEGKK